ncbi:MAG: acyloxyacyl hydrolase [Bacteroidia bacterium]|nr:acyloxyacyl hydrolase [Bacteroidia bacterium]
MKSIVNIRIKNKLKKLFYCLIHAFPYLVYSQINSNQVKLPYYTASFHYANIYEINKAVQDLKESNPICIELLFTKQLRDEKSWQENNCYFNSGIGLNYINYDNALLGESLALFYVFEPQFKLGKQLKLLVSANLGLIYLSKPYDKDKNANNLSYSSPISAYMALGTGIAFPLNKNLQMSLLAQYIHISNGGTHEPNKGINMSTINMRLSYNPIDNGLEKYQRIIKKIVFKDRLDFGLYVSNQNMGVNEPERYFIFGAMANFSKQIAKRSALTVGLEIINDQVTKARLQRDKIDKSDLRLGLLIGHEFLFGHFIVNQQLGYYLINETNYFNILYQRAGVSLCISSNFSIGFSVLTHTTIPNFTDLRLVYYIRK